MIGVPEHIFFPSLSSVELLSHVFSPSHFSLSSASSGVASRSPDSLLVSSSPCPVTIRFRPSIVFLRYSTSPTNLATSVHPLHLNTVLPFISAQGWCTPMCRTVCNSYSRSRSDAFSAPSFRSIEWFVCSLKRLFFST